MSGQVRTSQDRIRSFLQRIPFSFALAAILLAAAAFSGTLFGSANPAQLWGQGVDNTFLAGRWWTPFTALLIPQDATATLVSAGGAVLLLGVAERVLGTKKATIAFLATGLAGGVLGVLMQWVGTLTWEWWSTSASGNVTLDPVTGIFGALATASGSMGLLWRRRTRVVLVSFVLIFVLYSGDPEDFYRLLAVLVGIGLGIIWHRRNGASKHAKYALTFASSSHRETRTLVAAVVLVTAIGPLVAFLGSTDLTPFAFGSYLVMNDAGTSTSVAAACHGASPISRACIHQLARLGSHGPGMMALAFVPVVLLALAAWGLYRGRRFGWWLAVCANAAILFAWPGSFGVTRLMTQSGTGIHRPFNGQELNIWIISAALVPVGSLVMLWIKRKDFGIRAPRQALQHFWVIIGGAFLTLSIAYTLSALLVLKSLAPHVTAARVLLDVPHRFIPPHFLSGLVPLVLPRHSPVSWAYQWAGPVFWTIFVVASLWLLSRSSRTVSTHDGARFRELLRRHGGGSLGHMATWEGNTPWFTHDGEGALAYRVVNGHALVLGEPVCSPVRVESTVQEFLLYCDAQNFSPVFYSFHNSLLPVFGKLGWRHLPVGEESIIKLTGFSLKGKAWQSVRTSLNKAIRDGRTTVWTSWHELPLAATSEIEAISEAWLAENKLPEMGFTLGGIEELNDPEVRLMLAVAEDGHIEAVTSWMPVYEHGQAVGWTLDFMRRAPESENGVMEFLIASAALQFQRDGVRFLSLSGAPLATKPADVAPEADQAPSTDIAAFQAWLSRTLEPAYGFGSLFRFKAKFHPEYSTLYMAFPDLAALPTIGMALARAYLPDVSTREGVVLARTLGRKD
ncbi:bifunctional lysylphosphatidylglycerol flippase/synthetase MprF [Pseudarthrobacter sp. J1763]|uniref:bifunctional lysylphosphatidylglycerol flippase/synthetase MprF n=1 Tax=Pseudarthrobacter sp. J1763 TaxID=3420445 RepID=UPI003D2E1416